MSEERYPCCPHCWQESAVRGRAVHKSQCPSDGCPGSIAEES